MVLLKSSLKFWQYNTNERNGQGNLIIICNTSSLTGFLKITDQTTIYQPTTVQQEIWGPENCLTYILHKLRFWKLKHQILAIILCSVSCTHVKGNAEFVQKVTSNPWRVSNKTIIEVGNITKTAIFKSVPHLLYKNKKLLFLWQCFLILSWEKH